MFSIHDAINIYVVDLQSHKYVTDTFALNPKNQLWHEFNASELLTEIDIQIFWLKSHNVSNDVINYIKVCTVKYKNAYSRKMLSKHWVINKRYLKENNLFAGSFDNRTKIFVIKIFKKSLIWISLRKYFLLEKISKTCVWKKKREIITYFHTKSKVDDELFK